MGCGSGEFGSLFDCDRRQDGDVALLGRCRAYRRWHRDSASPAVRNQNVLITITAANGTAGTVNGVTVDASAIGGSATLALVNSGSNVWTNSVIVTPDTVPGGKTMVATITDSASLTAFANIPLTIVFGNDVWNGAGADNNLSSALNWTNKTAPAPLGDSFQFSGSTRTTPNVDADYTVTGILFGLNAASFNIGSAGNTLTLTNGTGVVNNSANVQTINAPIARSLVRKALTQLRR